MDGRHGFLLILSPISRNLRRSRRLETISWWEETVLSVKRHDGPSVAAYVWLVIDTSEFVCTALCGDETTSTLSLQLSGARKRLCVNPSTSKSCRYFSVLSKTRCFCRCSDLFAKLLLSRLLFFASPPRSDLSFCRGFKKMLQKETNRHLIRRDLTQIRAVDHPTDDEFFCICVGCFTFERWDGDGIGRASKMVNLGFAFPLEARVVLWTSRIAITASEATEKRKVTEHQWRNFQL